MITANDGKPSSTYGKLRPIIMFGALVVLFSLLSDLANTFCLVGAGGFYNCAPHGSVVDKLSDGSTRNSNDTKTITITKTLVNQMLLPAEGPDTRVGEKLNSWIPVNATKGEIMSPLLTNCSATSQVRIQQYSDASWTLVSLDTEGRNKTMGGDEYYVTYTDASSKIVTLAAFDHDNGDGTYTLDFSTTPLNPVNITGRGRLTVHLQYTCGIGAIPQPLKNKWVYGGACHTNWSRANVTTPSYRIFSPPTDAGIDFSNYSMVIGYGDSLMEGFFRDKGSRAKHMYRQNTTLYRDNPGSELNNGTVTKLMNTLRKWHGQLLNRPNGALVIGSAVWDLGSASTVDPDFVSHLEGARRFVEQLRQEYPNVRLYWKSGSAFQSQVIGTNCPANKYCRTRTKYMTNSRARLLYEKQKRLMAELDVPFLDLWEAYFLSGDQQLQKGDGRHYSKAINRHMQSWFYRGD
jgi:hypothetical protein